MLLNGFCHAAKHVRVQDVGQVYCAATVSKLDAVLGRFILMPMSFDASLRFKFCSVAGCKYQSSFCWQDFFTIASKLDKFAINQTQ